MTEFVMARIDYADGERTTVEVTRTGYEEMVAEGILHPLVDGEAVAVNGEVDVDDIMIHARHIVEAT